MIVRVVSWSFAVPSNTMLESERYNPETTGDVKVLFVKVSVVARPTKVSVASGSVNMLSAVGSPTVNVVSYESATAPSNTILASDRVRPETTGDVRVLLVSVSVVSLPTSVVVASGIVTVLSAVGSSTTRDV